MTLRKKDYEKIANILNDIPNEFDEREAFSKKEIELMRGTKTIIAKDLADYFEKDNEKFDRAKFLKACGVE